MDPAPAADDFQNWEPSDQDFRDMLIAEEESLYFSWLDLGDPFDFSGESYAEEHNFAGTGARPLTDFSRAVEEAIEAPLQRMRDRRGTMVLDHRDLAFAVDFDEASFESPDHLADAYPDLLTHGLGIDVLAAGRLLAERDRTFWPELRKLGPTPELLRRANTILAGHEYEREQHRSRPRPRTITFTRPVCSRARESRRTAPGRHQGSRRVSSRSAGGGSSGDPDPSDSAEPELGLHLWRHARFGSCSPNLLRVIVEAGR